MLRWISGGVLLILVSAFQADAAPEKKWSVGNWVGEAHFDDKKTFESCSISATFRSGMAVMYRIGRDFAWDINLYKPLWNLDVDSRLPVELKIDDFAPLTSMAHVTDRQLIEIPLEHADRAANLLRRGRVLRIKAGASSAEFDLNGTYPGISRLAQCVARHLSKERKSTKGRDLFASLDPRKTKAKQRRRKTRYKRIDRTAATVFISNLLIKSGQSDFKILTPKEHPLKGYEVIWKTTDGVIGAFTGFKKVKGVELQRVAAQLVAREARACKGDVASGRKAATVKGTASLQRLFVACRQEKESFEVHHTLVEADAGTFLKISHLAFGDGDHAMLGDADTTMIQHADWTALN